jgi:Ni/Co efflux regulator RcnB
MKRIVLSALALSMLALPVTQASAGPRHEPPRPEAYNSWKQPGHPHKAGPKKKLKKHHWVRGHKVPDWHRRPVVRDYHRHGLHRPGPGQHWIRVDNDFLLVSIASGIIGGIIASQY